jgi:hypothetical protein
VQLTALANSLQVHCLLESQEAFSVSGNNLLVACSEEKKRKLVMKIPTFSLCRNHAATVLILSARTV